MGNDDIPFVNSHAGNLLPILSTCLAIPQHPNIRLSAKSICLVPQLGSVPVLEPTLPILVPAHRVQTLFLPPISLLSQFVSGTFWSTHSCPYPFFPPGDPDHVSSEPYRQSWLYSAVFRDPPLLLGFTNKPRFLKALPAQVGWEPEPFPVGTLLAGMMRVCTLVWQIVHDVHTPFHKFLGRLSQELKIGDILLPVFSPLSSHMSAEVLLLHLSRQILLQSLLLAPWATSSWGRWAMSQT